MLASPQELQRKLNQGDSVINRKKNHGVSNVIMEICLDVKLL